MNCEQVKELLSAYLDNMLTPEERYLVATHLQSCSACSAILSDYSKNDTLIALLPRVNPGAALRERLFSSPEFLEIRESDAPSDEDPVEWMLPPITRLPAKHPRRDTPGRPQLVAIPGGRSTQPTPAVDPSRQPTQPRHRTSASSRAKGRSLRIMIAAFAAALVLALGLGGLFGYNILSRVAQTAHNEGITPPAGPPNAGPLSAGSRYVLLRGGTLWSELADGSENQPDRLTPSSVMVAPNWIVSNPLPGRSAGDRLAYIDLSKAQVHIIRSDGQQDTVINQPLLKAGITPASAWETDTGTAILNSLAWSNDGNSLAFLADPLGTGRTSLYIYSSVTNRVTTVPSPVQGSAGHPGWSPDSTRLAFEVTRNGLTSIVDYNVLDHGELTIANGIGGGGAGDSVLSLDWSPDAQAPAITWSTGVIGHVHGLWIHYVGVNINSGASLLLSGDYAQAIYSRNSHGVGSWLVISSVAGQAGDIWRIDITPGSHLVRLTSGRQVNFAQWSPDGSSIDYLDALSAGLGTLHVVNAQTASERLIASAVTDDPAPAWSADSRQIAFSTGMHVGIAGVQSQAAARYPALKGAASALTWTVTSPQQLIVTLNDGQQGIYLVDTQHGTSRQIDKQGADGPLLWTMIP